jgi:hypothetical protein
VRRQQQPDETWLLEVSTNTALADRPTLDPGPWRVCLHFGEVKIAFRAAKAWIFLSAKLQGHTTSPTPSSSPHAHRPPRFRFILSPTATSRLYSQLISFPRSIHGDELEEIQSQFPMANNEQGSGSPSRTQAGKASSRDPLPFPISRGSCGDSWGKPLADVQGATPSRSAVELRRRPDAPSEQQASRRRFPSPRSRLPALNGLPDAVFLAPLKPFYPSARPSPAIAELVSNSWPLGCSPTQQ